VILARRSPSHPHPGRGFSGVDGGIIARLVAAITRPAFSSLDAAARYSSALSSYAPIWAALTCRLRACL
jgi:hypothetical protein